MSAKLKNVLNGVMIGAGFIMPQLGIAMLASYAAKKTGGKVGDSIYYSKVKKAGKDELSADSVKMDGLDNVYLNPSTYNTYFDKNTAESRAYINEKAKKVLRLGEEDELMRIFSWLENEYKKDKDNENILEIFRKNSIKDVINGWDYFKDKEKILNNLDEILDKYASIGLLFKSDDGENPYFSRNPERNEYKKRYYFEGENNSLRLKFFDNPMSENYSDSGNISIVKPENVLFRTIPGDDEGFRKIKSVMSKYRKVIVKDGNGNIKIVERWKLKNEKGQKILIPSNLIQAMIAEEKKRKKTASMAAAPAPAGAIPQPITATA